MTNDTPPDQPAEPAAAPAKPKPLGPDVDPLHAMLHFPQAVSGDFRLKITDANAPRIFALMRKELPSLERADIVFGAGAASMIATQMRALSWRLQAPGHGDPPKTPKPASPRRPQAVHIDPNDPKILALPGVMAHWREHLGLKTKWRVAHVIKAARNADDFEAALLSIAGVDGAISNHRLGIWLSKVEGRSVDGIFSGVWRSRTDIPDGRLNCDPERNRGAQCGPGGRLAASPKTRWPAGPRLSQIARRHPGKVHRIL